MNPDIVDFAGYMLASWASGWVCGYFIYWLRRILDLV